MTTDFRLQDDSWGGRIDKKLRVFLEQSLLGAYLIQHGAFVYVNETAARIFGYETDELEGQLSLLDLAAPDERRDVKQHLHRRRETGSNDIRYTFRGQHKDGHHVEVEVHGYRIFHRGNPAVMGTLRDVTGEPPRESRGHEDLQKLKRRAYYDEITGLPNRKHFSDELEQYMQHARDRNELLSVLLVGFNDLVEINQGYGYRTGESILRSLAERFQERLCPGTVLCRWCLEKFVVLLRNPDDVRQTTQDLLQLFDDPIDHDDSQFFLTANIGIASFPDHAEDAEQLIDRANHALERAQENGDNNYAIYSPGGTQSSRLQIRLSTDLRKALQEDQFTLRYLPIFDLAEGHMSGVEALIRWNHPTFGTLDPDVFIPVAERSGLITDIDELVFERACREFQAPFGESAGLELSLNLSASNFHKRDFGSRLNGYLHETGVDPENITLEVTEHTLMEDVERARRILSELRELGMRIAVDDFGTGYSSFRYLAELPVDILKIDRSFVQSLGEKPGRDTLVSVLGTVGNQLDLELVAEGVETRDQLRYLSEQGCDRVQGFLFSPPISFSEIPGLFGETMKP